ncbi:Proline-specific permease [Cytospora mali]|uniref:Proline-specific permease n=1 Tax=Cytospora mali TaxID=578113 RepID=A0A194W822_CYTMA|nr:Proline-specific permease [Valsa mali]
MSKREDQSPERWADPKDEEVGEVRILDDGTRNLIGAQDQLERGLKSRHIQFLALGGAIGTGLFIGSGSILELGGPLALLLGYLIMMIIVWNIMNILAEIAVYLPLKGATIPYFVERFVEPSLAFAAGWNYWYAYAILFAAEASAGPLILEYWDTPVPSAAWIAIILCVNLLLNVFAVKIFGEAEFWFASIKLLTIVGLIITGLCIMCGGAPDGKAIGFWYWQEHGPIKEYLVSGNTGRFLSVYAALLKAGFSYVTSPELIALAAGETVAPRRNIPKAAGRFIWRLAIFYGVGAFIIGSICPSTDPRLLSGASNASASPWVIGITLRGIPVLAHLINAAILTSAWSAGNAFLYSGSRILYAMALNGQAPAIFAKTGNLKSPYMAILATWAVGLLAFLSVSQTSAVVFNWFVNISTISGLIAWVVCCITYLRFRKAMDFRGLLHTLPYKTRLQPYGTYFVMSVLVVLTLTNGFAVFFPGNWDVGDFLAAYITLPIFMALYLGHKLWFRTPWARSTEEIDVITGVREMDALEAEDRPPVAKNWAQKAWFWVA